MILPKSVFFSFALSCGRYSLPSVYGQDSECPSETAYNVEPLRNQCPKGNDGVRYSCRVGFEKAYHELFPNANTDILTTSSCTGSLCEYCDCEEELVDRGEYGLTGRECNIEFTICPDGDQVCFHGAPCVKARNEEGEEEYICGCPLIRNDVKLGLITYVGEHCEYEPSDICEDDSLYDISKKWFCTNNGVCRDGVEELENKCKCEEGYYGLHCEFKEEPACDIECKNGGVCARGVKDERDNLNDDHSVNPYLILDADDDRSYSDTDDEDDDDWGDDDDAFDDDGDDDDVYSNEDDEDDVYTDHETPKKSSYCVCPKGWTGVACDIQLGDTDNRFAKDRLECDNASVLMTGSKNYASKFPEEMISRLPFLQITSIGDKFCECGDGTFDVGSGYTSVDCAVAYETCVDGSVCFNGAPCQHSEDESYHCACPAATHPFGKPFVGESCEYQVTSYCKSEAPGETYDVSAKGDWYCTNGGDCRDGVMRPNEKCKCIKGFYGLHCELMEEPVCELECSNNGVCKNGVKDYKSLSYSLQKHFNQDKKHDTHCICPKGFTGLLCDIGISTCGDNHCLNGGVCENGNVCDCTDASKLEDGKVLKFAGTSCEIPYTTLCKPPSGHDQYDFFCANNGKCPADAYGRCVCNADYNGPRCEFLVVNNVQECNFQCQNGGTCFFGDKSSNMDSMVHIGNSKMNCKCPEGFSGTLCEIDICGGKHVCMNNGVCKSTVEEKEGHPGCECPDYFIGAFCEVSIKDQERDMKRNRISIVLWTILSTVLCAFLVLWTIMCYARSKITKEREQTPVENASAIDEDLDIDEYNTYEDNEVYITAQIT